ncbi:MAG: hypothetical protein UT09_C0035G0008 [Parcubacteria group bacterium GW2011_GWF2_38_8]|nr:MAG: hypothetical protein UT09_C0035G0008 [Parcubacteria group bacterium GW2011_GWF2_38_8]HIG95760.1 hypothetical protein [Candidatus Woesearchaeota archaeon]HIH47049.1 hypothetical protein [Candidatus Woesearchaeota archaeon]HII88539.1 hypothetical protein [Candidatus Woesearchaeota archaeon]
MAARKARIAGSYKEASSTGRAQRRLDARATDLGDTLRARKELTPAMRMAGRTKEQGAKKRNVTQWR